MSHVQPLLGTRRDIEERHLHSPAVKLELADRVVERALRGELPRRSGACHTAETGESGEDRGDRARASEADDATLVTAQRVAERRTHDLQHSARTTVLPEVYGGDVCHVHVATHEDDRRGRLAFEA